jgi:Predicted integral membrane protein (DUF2269)
MTMRYLHTTAVSAWIGGGLAVLVLLGKGRGAGNSDELHAINCAVAALDEILITPAAVLTFGSGLLLCATCRWGLLRHRWIMAKLLLTLAALAFGALCLAPWLRELSVISSVDGLAVFDDGNYLRRFRIGVLSGIFQSLLLLALVLISILKPSFDIQKKPDSSVRC